MDHEKVSESSYSEAKGICERIFRYAGAQIISLEEVQVYGPHEVSLVPQGDVKDFFLRHPNMCVRQRNLEYLDMLSFLCEFSETAYPVGWYPFPSTFEDKPALGEEVCSTAIKILQAWRSGPWTKKDDRSDID
jgi:hypothetical protein